MTGLSAKWRLAPEDLHDLIWTRPRTADQLHFWAEHVVGLNVPRRAVCAEHGHCAPFDYLKAAYFDEFDDAVVWANRGGGKTLLGAIVTLLDGHFKPGVAVRILGGSLEQSRKMYGYLRRLLAGPLAFLVGGLERTVGGRGGGFGARHVRFVNGSEVEILAQSERSVRGNRVQKMRCDEVELFDTDVWTSCQLVTESRQQGPGVGDRKSAEDPISDCGSRIADGAEEDRGRSIRNPKSEIRDSSGPGVVASSRPAVIRGAVEAFSTLHRVGGLMQQVIDQAARRGSPVFRWCVLDVLEPCPADRACADCLLADDCRGRAKGKTDGFFRIDDAIAARRRVSREVWESEMLCLRPSRRGTVFPDFSRARHVARLPWRPDRPLFRAIDFGFVNPFVCLWLQTDGRGNVFVLREYLRSRATVAANAWAVRQLDPGPVKMSYCDPAGGQADQITGSSPRAELRAAGIATRCHASRVGDGIELIRRYLENAPDPTGAPGSASSSGRSSPPMAIPGPSSVRSSGLSGPALFIDPCCQRLIEALEAYRYPDENEARFGSINRELPLKDGVHDHPIDALRYFFINHVAAPTGRVVERLY